ncbi:programmed cell death protein 2-like [Hylaeus volcanicus]|uniref:programmed cell death protein 2-like n=1 Tax=Hylaeus volcanicus TaxID=313075 RepID=UPI0023B79DE9|nr:programmed cell death protein 2-like [Hylaeus volcanicus]
MDHAETFTTVNKENHNETKNDSDSLSIITLGYLENPEFPHSLHRRFFPCKAGGKPAWLDPENIPDGDKILVCHQCQLPMTFVLQIYASRDQPSDAFHRSIYIFACCNCTETFIALRCQLPKHNRFYPPIPADVLTEVSSEDDCLTKHCCVVCGIPTNQIESRQEILCMKNNNIGACTVDLRIHNRCKNSIEWGCAVSTFPEAEIVIEDEDMCTPLENENDLSYENELIKRYRLQEQENADNTLDTSEQAAFEEIHNQHSFHDKTFSAFINYMRQHPSHIIRYAPKREPLWISSHKKPTCSELKTLIHPCENCGGQREFEFQVQPNLIHYLRTDRLSFGVLCIFTCKNSCTISNGSSRYVREVVLVQPEPFRVTHS